MNITGHGTHPLHSRLLLRGQLHHLRAHEVRERTEVDGRLGDAEQLRELLGVLREELDDRRVVHRDLLQDRLDRLRVRLHQLAQLLDLRVVLDRGDVDVARLVDRDRDALAAGGGGPGVLVLLLLLLRELWAVVE